jgi:aldehyde:ferredoxin oxidoreductase
MNAPLFGRVLRVNLSAGTTDLIDLDPAWVADYVGGGSLAARVLYERLHAGVDPLGPDNPLLFLTGPLTGTAGPAVGRHVVCARSPHTGLWGESNCGGFWGAELRQAGFDGVLIEGCAERPVYLSIRDGVAELHDAAHLWGLDTYATQERVRAELAAPGARVTCIGPAAERGVRYALILNDHGRVAGRTGMGLVMASKRLKAIAVKGSAGVRVHDEASFKMIRSLANRELRGDMVARVLRETGSAGSMEYFDALGSLPKRYYTAGEFAGVSRVAGTTMTETILTGVKACHACVIACGREVAIKDGPYTRPESKGPEYETIAGFGPLLMIDDLPAIVHLGQLCDAAGMDVISCANTIGLAFYLFDQGIINERDTGGVALRWGDARAAERLVELTARAEGFGALLAQGARALGAHFGAEDLAVQVNGLEAAYHDPRALSGMALVYMTSPRGACHNQGDYYMVELGNTNETLGIEFVERGATDGKAANVARHQDWTTLRNSAIVCLFANVPPEHVIDLLQHATGVERTVQDLLASGERGWNLKRLINGRLGLKRANDRLPRLLLEPLADGPVAGQTPDVERLLADYYAVRGWDPGSGQPAPDRLARLGLGWTLAARGAAE